MLIALTIGVGRCSWVMYHLFYDLLDFQITRYRYSISARDHRENLQIDAKNGIGSFLDLLGGATKHHAELLPKDTFATEQKIAQFTAKIHYISLGISILIGVLVWKILFDIMYTFKQLLNRVSEFVIK